MKPYAILVPLCALSLPFSLPAKATPPMSARACAAHYLVVQRLGTKGRKFRLMHNLAHVAELAPPGGELSPITGDWQKSNAADQEALQRADDTVTTLDRQEALQIISDLQHNRLSEADYQSDLKWCATTYGIEAPASLSVVGHPWWRDYDPNAVAGVNPFAYTGQRQAAQQPVESSDPTDAANAAHRIAQQQHAQVRATLDSAMRANGATVGSSAVCNGGSWTWSHISGASAADRDQRTVSNNCGGATPVRSDPTRDPTSPR